MKLDDYRNLPDRTVSHAQAIGQIAMQWNRTERRFHVLVASVLRLPISEGTVMMSQIGSVTLGNILKLAQNDRASLNGTTLFSDVVAMIDVCRDNRNLFVHGLYTSTTTAFDDNLLMLRERGEGGQIKTRGWGVTLDELEEVRVELVAAESYLSTVINFVCGEDNGGPDRQPLPPPPLKFRRRTETMIGHVPKDAR